MWTTRTLLLLLLVLSSTALVTGQKFPSAPRIAEASLRRAARKIIMPEYPQDSINRRSKGVAVAQVVYDEAGLVSEVEILEAPDDLIKKAVIKALRQWKFEPARIKDERGLLTKIQGKLTFYFVINGRGEAQVENPKQFKSSPHTSRN